MMDVEDGNNEIGLRKKVRNNQWIGFDTFHLQLIIARSSVKIFNTIRVFISESGKLLRFVWMGANYLPRDLGEIT
jgi:hypothetical protein